MEKRRGRLIGFSRQEVEENISAYLNPENSFEDLQAKGTGPVDDAGDFDAFLVRSRILGSELFDYKKVIRYVVCPFDTRWAYHTNVNPIWNRSRPTLRQNYLEGNSFFITRAAAERTDENIMMMMTTALPDHHLLRPHVVAIPIFWNTPTVSSPNGLFDAPLAPPRRANLSPRARAYLASLSAPNPDTDPATAAMLWHHALAVGFSAAYLTEHAGGIATDWPRVPLPDSLEVLRTSAALGARVAALLDDPQAETPPEVTGVGRLTRTDAALAATQGYEVRAGWGALQRGNVVMPGRGRVALRAAESLDARLGNQVADIGLNDGWSWAGVPLAAWQYTIGGYQVMKKWLSYREFGVLGRALTLDEAREVSSMARRLSALVLLQGALDASYR
jgi:Type ISP C-terminal specificity domain